MEALTLSVPPTLGNSIVSRSDNEDLFYSLHSCKIKRLSSVFIYDGDGYYDNINNFFGDSGFDIMDRNSENPLSDKMKTTKF